MAKSKSPGTRGPGRYPTSAKILARQSSPKAIAARAADEERFWAEQVARIEASAPPPDRGEDDAAAANDDPGAAVGEGFFRAEDLDYLRYVCAEPEFEDRCMVALRLAVEHHQRDRARGQATDTKERIRQLEREWEALQVLLARRWADDQERALRRMRQDLYVEMQLMARQPKRGSRHALDVAAVLVVKAFKESRLAVDTSTHERSAVAVLKLICACAGISLSVASYKAAINGARS